MVVIYNIAAVLLWKAEAVVVIVATAAQPQQQKDFLSRSDDTWMDGWMDGGLSFTSK